LNAQYGFTFDVSLADPERYRYTRYQDWFLGSLGKKVTLAQTVPDDFILIRPAFATDFSVRIPELNLSARGDFDVLIDHSQLDIRDYYTLSPYGAYCYGDRPVITIHNNLSNNNEGKTILLIKDSFAEVVTPFLSMGVEDLHILDLRHFNGSLKSYIEKNRPNIVILMYNPSAIDDDAHKKMFDFR
jgi:hypothetical protein